MNAKKLSEEIRWKMNYPHAKAGTKTALKWADKAEVLEKKLERFERREKGVD